MKSGCKSFHDGDHSFHSPQVNPRKTTTFEVHHLGVEKEYYRAYFELERSHWWFTAREKIIHRQLELLFVSGRHSKGAVRILNVGCGTGRSTEYLSTFGEVISVDSDSFCCEFTRNKTGIEIIHASADALPFADASFDLVCAFDVIEHIENDARAVQEMKRVCKTNGTILITTPAFMSQWSYHDVVNHHFRRYRMGELRKLFRQVPDGTEGFSSYFNCWLFLPVLLVRKTMNLLNDQKRRKGTGSDFETFVPGQFNGLLHAVMTSENLFLGNKIPLPFGVSLIFTWLKNK